MVQTAKIYIAGHRGMVRSGLERKLRKEGYHNIITRMFSELDLRNQKYVSIYLIFVKIYKFNIKTYDPSQ
jgi:GDP-L-fucose synthase